MKSISATGLRNRLAVAVALMAVIPLLYVGYLFSCHMQVSLYDGLWIFLAVIFLVLGVGTGAAMIQHVFRSIGRITEAAKALAAGAAVPAAVEVTEGGEMGDLARSINDILVRIREESSVVQTSRQELSATKEKLAQSCRQLSEAVEKLRLMDQMKSDFVANVAHELIHPLATIRSSLDLILANLEKEDPQKKEIVEVSRRNMVRLIRLVGDILDISRIESGKMNLRLETVDVAAMVREILIPLQKLFDDKQIRLSQKVAPSVPAFQADRDRIIQAVTNLLVNAAKYTQAGGEVSLVVAPDGEGIKFAIYDNGPGMSAVDQKKLFDKYSRITREKQEGTGLGLCITKDIISLHRGKIWVESQVGKGSTFAFVIPVRQG